MEREDALDLIEQVMTTYHLHAKTEMLYFWVGPLWNHITGTDYIRRLRDIETITGRRMHWSKLAPMGVQSYYANDIKGFIFPYPDHFVKDLVRFKSRIERDSEVLARSQIRDVEELCVASGFKPIHLLEFQGDNDFVMRGVVCPAEADAVMLSAWWGC